MKEQKLGIYCETDPLKKVAVWGTLGSEAVLAQLYPTSVSLFFDDMNVPKARSEASAYSAALKSHGVEVHEVRDKLAKLLPAAAMTRTMVMQQVWDKAKAIGQEYGSLKPDTYDEIAHLIELDCQKYGEEKAAALNIMLSVKPTLPMGNTLYSRDQMNVLFGTMFQSTMAKDIRKPEVGLYNMVYKQLGLPDPTLMPQGETFEGGDAYIHDKVVYVGAGPRSTLGSALHIFKSLQTEIEALGYGFAVVYDADAQNRSEKDQMDFMHLDTFSMPLSPGKLLLCAEEAQRRKILTVSQNNGSLQVTETGLSFMDFLEKQAQEIYVIPLEEQQFFGCNFLNLDPRRLLMPVESNNVTNGMLIGSGKEILLADLFESTKGYGGAHCMTAQLLREG